MTTSQRIDTERGVRLTARKLLVEHGRDAVTLRAIARALGITAPALYRYYDSREALLRKVCEDICADLAGDLQLAIAQAPANDIIDPVLAACRGFRTWALAHPEEFGLVFATPTTRHGCNRELAPDGHEQFARVFLRVALPIFTGGRLRLPDEREVPAELHAELLAYRDALITTMHEEGYTLDPRLLPIPALYLLLESWAHLYGHVALEVFGQLRFALTDAGPLFESMLSRMLGELGVGPA